MRSVCAFFVALFFWSFLSCGEDIAKEEKEEEKEEELAPASPMFIKVNPPIGSKINDFAKIVVSFYFPGGNIPANFTVSSGNIADIIDAYPPTHKRRVPLRLDDGNVIDVSTLNFKDVIITIPHKYSINALRYTLRHTLEIAWGDKNVVKLAYDLRSSIDSVWVSEDSREHPWFSIPIYPQPDSEVVPSSIDTIQISFTEDVNGSLHVRRSDNDGNAIGNDHGWTMARGDQNNTLVLVKGKEGRKLSDGMFILEGLVKNDAGNDMEVSIPFVLDDETPAIDEIFGRWKLGLVGSVDWYRHSFATLDPILDTIQVTPISKLIQANRDRVDERMEQNEFTLMPDLRWEGVVSYSFVDLHGPGGNPARPLRHALGQPIPEPKRYRVTLFNRSGSVFKKFGDRVYLKSEQGKSAMGWYRHESQLLYLIRDTGFWVLGK